MQKAWSAYAQCWTSAYIKNLVVHPRAQRLGLGRALLLNAFKVFQQRREGFVDLKVLEDNLRAQRLYENVPGSPGVCED
jgi:ribosomal protein S18 acetylase RimI-like enzyme